MQLTPKDKHDPPDLRRGATCSLCGADVFAVLLDDGDRVARVVINATRDSHGLGRIAAYQDSAGIWYARVLEGRQAPRNHERRHRRHDETCHPRRV
jgi:hypothetical protein